MTVYKKDLHQLVDHLREHDQKTVYDFMRYLIDRQKDPYYHIDQLEPDDVPLNKEERKQFDSDDPDTVSLEDLKRELKL